MPDKLLGEIGTSGLQQYSGYVQEEYLRELIGERGRRVIRQMINDYLIGAILFAISMLIRQVQWSVVAASESKEDQEVAEFVDGCREDMSSAWEDTLVDILTCLPWGWSYLETVYKVRTGDNADPSKRSKYTDKKIGWRKWAIRGQETLDRWEFDEAGGIKGMWQAGATYSKPPVLIPIEKALHFKAGGAKGNPEGVSVFRSAYEPWYFRRNIIPLEYDAPDPAWRYVDAAGKSHQWKRRGKSWTLPTLKKKRHVERDSDTGETFKYVTYHDPVNGERVFPGYHRKRDFITAGPTEITGEFESDTIPPLYPDTFDLRSCDFANSKDYPYKAAVVDYSIEMVAKLTLIRGHFQVIGAI